MTPWICNVQPDQRYLSEILLHKLATDLHCKGDKTTLLWSSATDKGDLRPRLVILEFQVDSQQPPGRL